MAEESWERKWKKKSGAICLPYTVQVVIPHTCKPHCAKAYQELRQEMTRLFGGSTTYSAEGAWMNPKGKLVPDRVKVIESAHSCMTPPEEREFEEMVYRAANIAKQEAIAVKTGQYLIMPTKVRK